jgi:hypothetical protein
MLQGTILQRATIVYNGMAFCCFVPLGFAVAWHGLAWHGLAWHGMAWHGMAWQAALGLDNMQPDFLLTVLQQIVSGMIYLHQVSRWRSEVKWSVWCEVVVGCGRAGARVVMASRVRGACVGGAITR